MATDNTTQESRNETIQILTLHPKMEPRVFDYERTPMWEDVIENGATLSQSSPFVWYLVVDIPQDEIYAQPFEFWERQQSIWHAPRERLAYVTFYELSELQNDDYPECEFCGKPASMSWEWCSAECQKRDKQGERL